MVIFLMILKIIGIVLLSVIGLVIFLLLLVIFCPICYHVNARHNEDETNVEFDARYLLVKALGSYNKDDGLKYLVKIPFYTIATSEDSEDSDNNEGGGSSGKDEFDEDFNLEDDSFADTGDSETSLENIEAASDSLESSSDEQEDEMILPNDEEIEANLKEQKKQEKLRKKHLHTHLQSVEQEPEFLRQHSVQRQRQTFSVSRQCSAVVFVHLCRQALRHLLRQDMIREMLTLSVSTR